MNSRHAEKKEVVPREKKKRSGVGRENDTKGVCKLKPWENLRRAGTGLQNGQTIDRESYKSPHMS